MDYNVYQMLDSYPSIIRGTMKIFIYINIMKILIVNPINMFLAWYLRIKKPVDYFKKFCSFLYLEIILTIDCLLKIEIIKVFIKGAEKNKQFSFVTTQITILTIFILVYYLPRITGIDPNLFRIKYMHVLPEPRDYINKKKNFNMVRDLIILTNIYFANKIAEKLVEIKFTGNEGLEAIAIATTILVLIIPIKKFFLNTTGVEVYG